MMGTDAIYRTGNWKMDLLRIAAIGSRKNLRRYMTMWMGDPIPACLSAICTPADEEPEVRLPDLPGVIAYEDPEALLAAGGFDGVVLCGDRAMNYRLAGKLLDRGIPVSLGVPFAATAQEAAELAQRAAASKTVCVTAFHDRYTLGAHWARKWLAQFDERERLSLVIHQAPCDMPARSLSDTLLTAVDTAVFYFGLVAQAAAFACREDALSVSLRFACGAVGSIGIGRGPSQGRVIDELAMTLRGSNVFELHNAGHCRIFERGRIVEEIEPRLGRGDTHHVSGHARQVEDFVNAIAGNHKPLSNIQDSCRTLVVYDAIQESLRTGSSVQPRYLPG